MKKRIISMMLVISMVLMYVPTTALAEGAGGTYTMIEGTGKTNSGEDAGKLFDSKDSTKWCVLDFSKTKASVIFQTSSAVNVSGYSITTGNDNAEYTGRNPKSWTLYGCNDYNTNTNNGSWTTIHSVTDDTVLEDKNFQTYNYVFEKTQTAYNYFKLVISAIKGGDALQVSEFQLTDCEHDWDESKTTTKENTCINVGFTSQTCSKCQGAMIEYKPKLGHDFSGEGGKCIRCNKTNNDVHTFNILNSNGSKVQKYCENEVTENHNVWGVNNSETENQVWYVVNSDVTIDSRVTVNGDVHLILADDCTLTVKGGIKVTGSNALTIYA